MYIIPAASFMNLGYLTAIAPAMKQSVDYCYNPKSGNRNYAALFCLICLYIDCLSGGEKTKYINTLTQHFPKLTTVIAPHTFYEKFRNGAIHRFAPMPGYGIAENHEIGGEYIATVQLEGQSSTIDALNIDRFYSDFLVYLDQITN